YLYVDDGFGPARPGAMRFYGPYGVMMPTVQAMVLDLFDFIRIPHDPAKQVHGTCLTIIGHEIDTELMVARMPRESLARLIELMLDFVTTRRRRTLREFQHVAGNVCWGLNVHPLIRPGLSTTYEKMEGKTRGNARIWVSTRLVEEFLWAVGHLGTSHGVFFFKSLTWTP
ncbi:hypothetical protein CONPUDRAFT_33907, partial [Coniophora puteana RWD-64-598 SS2]